MWRQVFENQSSSNPFAIQAADPLFSLPLGEDSIEFVYWLSPEAIWDRFGSLSQIAVLKDEEVAVSRQGQLRCLANGPGAECEGQDIRGYECTRR